MRLSSTEKKWLVLIVAVLVLALGASRFLLPRGDDGHIAEVYLHGELVERIDLSKVEKPYTFRLDTGDGGYNVIAVRLGEIEIIEANCPDQICVHAGSIRNDTKPIVCLPHEVVIKIDGKDVSGNAHDHAHDHDHEHDHDDREDAVDIVTR